MVTGWLPEHIGADAGRGQEESSRVVLVARQRSLRSKLGRVLVTNDDGIFAPGLMVLAAAVREMGHEVVVVAPDAR